MTNADERVAQTVRSVAGVRDALEAAYAAGEASVRPPTTTPPPPRGMNKTN